MADALPPWAAGQTRGGRIDLKEMRMRDNGLFVAWVSRDGKPLSLTLMKDLPWFEAGRAARPTAASIDRCQWTGLPRSADFAPRYAAGRDWTWALTVKTSSGTTALAAIQASANDSAPCENTTTFTVAWITKCSSAGAQIVSPPSSKR